jgi:hypothetical protein
MILIKEEMIGGEKWRRADELGGSDALVLWLALKCYCSQHPDTEGFIPSEVLGKLPGAPRKGKRALEALIACGRLLPNGERGPGLVEVVAHGWKLHDYLDHAPAPEEIELRREKARLRKQTYRDSKRRELAAVRRFAAELPLLGEAQPEGGDPMGHVPWDTRDKPGDTEGDVPGVSLAGAPPHEGARVPAPARALAQPNPTQPNQTKKSLSRLSSTIRDPLRVEPSLAQLQFANDHAVEIEPLLALVRSDAAASCLSADEAQARLGALLESAAARAIGGAA